MASLTTRPLHPGQLVDRLDHMHWHPDGPRLIGDGPGDSLPDPPRGIRGELVPAGVVELLHGADQPEVPLLDKVEEHQAAADVTLGDRHYQPQVRLDQPLFGLDPFPDEQLQVAVDGAHHRDAAAELLLGEQARLDGLGQLYLVLSGQQRHPADFPQVDPHQIAGDGPPAAVGCLVG